MLISSQSIVPKAFNLQLSRQNLRASVQVSPPTSSVHPSRDGGFLGRRSLSVNPGTRSWKRTSAHAPHRRTLRVTELCASCGLLCRFSSDLLCAVCRSSISSIPKAFIIGVCIFGFFGLAHRCVAVRGSELPANSVQRMKNTQLLAALTNVCTEPPSCAPPCSELPSTV